MIGPLKKIIIWYFVNAQDDDIILKWTNEICDDVICNQSVLRIRQSFKMIPLDNIDSPNKKWINSFDDESYFNTTVVQQNKTMEWNHILGKWKAKQTSESDWCIGNHGNRSETSSLTCWNRNSVNKKIGKLEEMKRRWAASKTVD